MNHIQEKQVQIAKNWEKILKQNTVYKTDVMKIYNQAKTLADMDDYFKSFKNSMNTQVNALKSGIVPDDRKEKITALCAQYLTIQEG